MRSSTYQSTARPLLSTLYEPLHKHLISVLGRDGLVLGDASTLGVQMVAIAATWIFAAVITFLLLKGLNAAMGLRVSTEEEQIGLDLSQHNEAGYTL